MGEGISLKMPRNTSCACGFPPLRGSAMRIVSDAEYQAAVARAQALMGCLEGTPEERELEQLSDAIEKWEQRARSR